MKPEAARPITCTVSGATNLPAEISEAAVCDSIAQAAAPVLAQAGLAPGALAVTVEVLSSSRMVAVASIGEKRSEQQHVASSDRPLNPGALKMLGDALAREIARMTR